jgi:hypothetical protein
MQRRALDLLQRAEMTGQSRRFDFHQIRFYMFDDSFSDSRREKINDSRMHLRRRCERPRFISILRNNFRDLVGEFLVNASVHLRCQLGAFADRGGSAVSACALSHWKAAREVAYFIEESSMRIGDIERLHKLQA